MWGVQSVWPERRSPLLWTLFWAPSSPLGTADTCLAEVQPISSSSTVLLLTPEHHRHTCRQRMTEHGSICADHKLSESGRRQLSWTEESFQESSYSIYFNRNNNLNISMTFIYHKLVMKRPTLQLYYRKDNKLDWVTHTALETPIRKCTRRRKLHRNNKAFHAVKDATVPSSPVIMNGGFLALRGLIRGCVLVLPSFYRHSAPTSTWLAKPRINSYDLVVFRIRIWKIE